MLNPYFIFIVMIWILFEIIAIRNKDSEEFVGAFIISICVGIFYLITHSSK